MCFSLSMYEGLRLDVRLVSLSVTTTRVVGLWQERSDLFSFWNTRQFKLFRSIYTWLCVVGDIRWQTKLKKTWNPKWSTIFLRQLNRASTYVSRFRGWVEDLSFPPSSHPPPPPHPPTTTVTWKFAVYFWNCIVCSSFRSTTDPNRNQLLRRLHFKKPRFLR